MGKPCVIPALPHSTVYIEAPDARILGAPLADVRLRCPFLLRTVRPKPPAGRSISHLLKVDGAQALTELEEMSLNTR